MIELARHEVRSDDDVVRAHQTARTVAAQLGFSSFEHTRIATAMSEITRNALTYAGGGTMAIGLAEERDRLVIVVLDRGPGIVELDAVLDGRKRSPTGLGVGIPGSRRLMDGFAIESTPAGTRVEMTKYLPRRQVADATRVSAVRTQLAGQLADDPAQELRRLEREVAERDLRILDLGEELMETNRGVMALHNELEVRAEYQRQAVELRTRLVSEMGHELRTPLHSITSISRFLIERLDGELTPEQDKQARIIHEVAVSLTDYVNDLLDLARADAGKARVHVASFSAEAILKTLRRMVAPLARGGVSLRLKADPELQLSSDEAKIAQVLRNLAANAMKFTERGEVAVEARAIAGDRVVFEVSDTGVGIAPEDHELIFAEFAQVDGRVQSRVRGSGLGLPLSRRIAELLGGTLTLTSIPGQGSTFRLELPREYVGEAEAPRARQPEVAPPTARPLAGELRILVIDDDVASRYVLRRWLGDRYRVDEAESGLAGLEIASSRPDAIFLDVVMPDLTGFEVLERLKAQPETRDIPVVVYTALLLGANDRARLAGAAAILRKSTASRVADRAAIEAALLAAGVAVLPEVSDG